MHVSDCFIHPLQSGKAIQCNRLTLTSNGPEHDRIWQIESADGRKISQNYMKKGQPKLALIGCRPETDGSYIFSAPGQENLIVADIRDSLIEKQAAQWFSEFLDIDCRLRRRAFINPKNYLIMSDAQLDKERSLPLLIASAASLRDLQKQDPFNANLMMNRFRPNIVIDGADEDSWAEDTMYEIGIGSTIIRLVLPQGRCPITTVDQETGEIPDKSQPLRALGKFRFAAPGQELKGVYFGQRAIVLETGTISIGDKIEILKAGSLHPSLAKVKLGPKLGSALKAPAP